MPDELVRVRGPDVARRPGDDRAAGRAAGRLPIEQFMAEHMRIEAPSPGKANELGTLLGDAMALIRSRG